MTISTWPSTVFLPSQQYIHPSHEQPFSSGECMGNGIKCFAEVQENNIHSLSFIHQAQCCILEGVQVSQAGSAFHPPMLTGFNNKVVLHVPCDSTQDDVHLTCKIVLALTDALQGFVDSICLFLLSLTSISFSVSSCILRSLISACLAFSEVFR